MTRAEVLSLLFEADLGASAAQLAHGTIEPGALAVRLRRYLDIGALRRTPERAACVEALRALARAESRWCSTLTRSAAL